jgi:hypothetical protein
LRIRSQSWRNELIEKHIRQKGPATPGFFLFAAMDFAGLLHATFLRPRISTGAILRGCEGAGWSNRQQRQQC